jgi:hypothetical protein
MKYFILVTFLTISLNLFSQTNQSYDLKWIIDKNNPIAYKTAMEPIDTNNLSKIGIDCDSFISAFSDTTIFNCEDFNEFFESINSFYSNYSMTTILSRDDKEAIDVKLLTVKNDSKINLPDSVPDFFTKAMTGVQLRGKINEDGGIESFYMKKDQMNLLAIMFELPTKPVKIGDKWTIQASFISNDHNFICNDYSKKHIVELVDVKTINGEIIAYIKYDIRYYVNGEFNNPFLGKTVPTEMDVAFNGISEFNITKGKWGKYNGIMSMYVTGIMNTNTKQRFSLIELKEIPEELLLVK